MISKDSSVLFATFSMWADGQRMPTNGNLEPLRNFLVPRVKDLVLIDQPHPGSDRLMPIIEKYHDSSLDKNTPNNSWWMYVLYPLLKLTNKNQTQLVFKIRDLLSVLDIVFKYHGKFDYFIGLESIHTFAGIILKKFGKARTVIYYVLDYSPNRYSRWFNSIYLSLDRYCATHADYVWDVSRAIHPARISMGLNPDESAPVIHVPIGIYPNQINTSDVKIKPYSLGFMGTLGQENGPDLAIEIMPILLKKYPTTTLHIVGGGQKNLERLKALVSDKHLEKVVIFHGFVPKSQDMADILRHCHLGLAPYRAISGSIRQYGDASKLRSYAAAGLPIVTTPVPPLGKELQEVGGAIIADDTVSDFSKAVLSLFSSPELCAKMRKQVIKFAKNNTWDNEFTRAFSQSQ